MLKDPHLKKNDLAVKLLGVEYISVYSAFEISFNDLKKEEQERYLEFAIFPKGFGIPKKMLEIFWNKDGYNVEKLVNTLDDCSLVKVENDNVVLYDIQHDFIRGELSSDYKLTLNNKLLVACKNRYGDWYKMPNNGYLFQNLAFHLSEAGKYDELRKILLDIRWLDKKLEYADIFGLISDYDYLGKQASDMGETIDTRLWQDALRLSAHVLSLDRFQLPSQLLGRLQGFETHATKELLKQADSWAYPWLKPLKASLTTPDSPLQKTLNNHRSPVRALAIARENGANKAISGSIDGVIKVWDIESGREINSKKLYECPVRCLSITPDGKRAVSGSDDKMIRIWDLDSIKEVCSPLEGHEDSVRCIAVYSNGKMAVSGSDDTTLRIWDLTEGVKRGDPLKGHESSVRCVAITSSGEKCISGSIDGTLRVWDISDPLKAKCIGTLRHNDMVNAVAITHDGKMVLSGSARGTIKVWSLESMEDKPIALLEGHADAVLSVAVSPDDSRAVSGSYDNTLRIWNLKDICNPSGKAMGTLAGHANCVRAVGFSNDEIVLSVSDDETFKIWSLNKLGTVQERKCHTDWINVIDVIPDAKRAISASDDKILKIWDSQNGKWIRDLKDHKLPVRAMSGFIDENGDTCIVSGSYDTSLKIWNITKDLKFDLEGEQHEGAIRATAVTQDGKFAISGSYDGEVKVWNIKTHQLSKSLKGHKGPVRAVATNKEMVISGSYDGTIRVWNLLNKADDKEIPAHNGWVNKLAVIPNDMVVSASEDGTIKIWSLKDPDLKSPKATHILRGHDGPIRSMAVSSNGKKIITGSSNGTLNIWTVTENIIDNGYPERQLAIKDYNVPIKAVAISSDGEFGVAGYNDGSLRVLNLNTDEYVSFTGDSPIIAIAITPKENVIIAGETSGRIHFLSPIGFNFKFNKIYQKKKFNYKENESSTKHDKIQYALDKCVKETKSELGYLAAVDYEGDNPQKVQMIYWSEDASKKCRVAHKTSEYSKDMMGLWGEPLRRKTTCKVDNYLISTHREGYPDGHFPLKNFLSVPIFDELGKIPYIVAVANKKENGYSNDDEKVLTEIGRILGVTQEETRKLLPEGGG
jgi:WD40 repeat protein